MSAPVQAADGWRRRVRRLLLLSLLLCAALPLSLRAQNLNISGTVRDGNGDPVAGASVVVKATTTGAATDASGGYAISAPADATLVFSFLGLTTLEEPVAGRGRIDVVLSESDQSLDEVVVVGYGVQKKVNLTGAVAQVNGQEVSARVTTDALTALQGQMPGVAILRSSGQPGSEASSTGIRIRGFSSANDANALILIDGVEGDLRMLSADDIESVSVLKDAAAASIYGARAAAGVVLVTTKKGTAQEKATVSYNGSFGLNVPGNMPQRLTPWEEQEFINISRINSSGNPEQVAENASWIGNPNYNYRPNNTRWEIFQSTNWLEAGINPYTTQQSHSVSVNGGHGATKYYVSGGYYHKNGMLKYDADNYSRYNLRATLNTELNKYVGMDVQAAYEGGFTTQPATTSSTFPTSSLSGGSAYILYLLYNNRGRQSIYNPQEDSEYGKNPYNGDLHANPIDMMQNGGKDFQRSETFTGNAGLHLKNFVKGLSIDLNASRKASYFNREQDKRYLVWSGKDGQVVRNRVNNPNSVVKTKNYAYQDKLEALVNYDFSLEQHALHLLGGASYEQYHKDQIEAKAMNLLSNDFFSVNYYDASLATNTALADLIEPWKMASLFGRLNYSYAGRYLLEATVRYDGSSRLDPSARWGIFPSVSAGWRVSEEAWFEGAKPFVDNLKLRTSWGKLGNSSVLNSKLYPYYGIVDNGTIMGNGMYYQSEMASKDITWEVLQSTNIGVDVGVLRNRLSLTADYYWKTNSNMTTLMQVGHIVGIAVPYQNVGKLKTWGWEVSAQWRDKVGDVSYSLGFNIDDSQNELTEYDDANVIAAGTVAVLQGYPLNTIWGYKTDGYWSSRDEYLAYKAANPGYQSFNDARVSGGDVRYVAQGTPDHTIGAGDGTPENHGDLVYLGTANGRYLYGVNLSAQWKGLDFSMFWQGVGKRSFIIDKYTMAPLGYSYEMPWTIHRDYWTEENTDAYWPRVLNQEVYNYEPSDKWVQDGAYVRLKNIQLGYTIPVPKNIVQSLRIYVSGSDVWEYSNVLEIFDPEVGNNTSSQTYPFFRTWTMGVNLTF
jgi:TonB-linked SusC/RagA family outer membrane protein